MRVAVALQPADGAALAIVISFPAVWKNCTVVADADLEQARAALDRGEMHHAADHLAGAIAHAPTLPETHELLSRLAAP